MKNALRIALGLPIRGEFKTIKKDVEQAADELIRELRDEDAAEPEEVKPEEVKPEEKSKVETVNLNETTELSNFDLVRGIFPSKAKNFYSKERESVGQIMSELDIKAGIPRDGIECRWFDMKYGTRRIQVKTSQEVGLSFNSISGIADVIDKICTKAYKTEQDRSNFSSLSLINLLTTFIINEKGLEDLMNENEKSGKIKIVIESKK